MKFIKTILLIFCFSVSYGQNFTYSGYIYNSNSTGIANVPVKIYKRTTPTLTGFTSQTNFNGHSYYRSTGVMTWVNAKAACDAMGGHLVTISNAAENNFVYNTWPSGWIGYYQDKTGGFYSEPNGGWRWTEKYVTTNQQADYDVASYTSGTNLTDIKSGVNATLYNSPVYTSTGGKYLSFNGINQYGMTGNLASKVPGVTTTLMAWIYPTGNGVIVTELGQGTPSSTWHDSQIEITGGNTLRIAIWNLASVSLSTPITLNTWNLVGFTYDGTTLTGYKNGASFGSIATLRQPPQLNGNGLYYGIGLTEATNLGSGAYGSFRLGSFQVYSSALTADEMNRNYMSTAWRFGVYPYSNWNGGEPNNSSSEDYIQFVTNGQWNDLGSSASYQYVLEFDYINDFTPWAVESTVYTDANGRYSISLPTNPSVEWYLEIPTLTLPTLTATDAKAPTNIALGTPINAKKYFLNDVNNDGRINVADSYYVYGKINGRFSSWASALPNYRIFTSPQWSTINLSNTDLRSTYPGVQTITITSPVNGGSSNFYVVRTGFAN